MSNGTAAAPPSPGPYARLALMLLAWLVAPLAGFLVFLPALRNGFIFDDNGEMLNFDGLFTPGGWPGLFLQGQYQLYRPIKYLSLHMDFVLHGWSPGGFHLTNLLMHAAVCAAAFGLLRRLGRGLLPAALAAVWFAVHPIHTEAVAWVTARGAILSALGVILCALAYLRWRSGGRARDLLLLAAAAGFAFFSKEDSLMLLGMLLALELWGRPEGEPFRMRRLVIALAASFLLAVLYLAMRQSLLEGVRQGTLDYGYRGLLAAMPSNILRYMLLLLSPYELVLEPPVDFTRGFDARFWIALAPLLALVAAFIRLPQGPVRWKLALAWFALFLFPTLGFIPINAPVADRFLYLPSFAGAILLADLFDLAWRRLLRLRGVMLFGLAVILAILGFASWKYTKVWRSDLTLWDYVASINPKSWRAWNNLAAEANRAGDNNHALEWSEKALALRPDYIEARLTRARSLDHLGRIPEAEADYRATLRMNPANPIALNLFADFLERQNRLDEAARTYERIFLLRPGFVEARVSAGVLAARQGRFKDARNHWLEALKVEPDNHLALHNLELLKADEQRANQKSAVTPTDPK